MKSPGQNLQEAIYQPNTAKLKRFAELSKSKSELMKKRDFNKFSLFLILVGSSSFRTKLGAGVTLTFSYLEKFH